MEILKDLMGYGPDVVRELAAGLLGTLSFLLFIALGLLAIIPALIASSKGHSFFSWWCFGLAMFIVALPAAFLIRPTKKQEEVSGRRSGTLKKCPRCVEFVKSEAIVCRFCGHEFAGGTEFEKEL